MVFRSFWTINDNSLVVGSELKLNFKPVIEHYNLSGDFVIIHWQAKPKGLRRWGIYDSATDQYIGADADKVAFTKGDLINLGLLQVDEKIVRSVPVAVLILQDCRARIDGNYIFIGAKDE